MLLTGTLVQLGDLSVPLPDGAQVARPVSAFEAVVTVDRTVAESLQGDYNRWAISAGWRRISSTSTLAGWSLVFEKGEDILVLNCGYESEHALLALLREPGDSDPNP
jgi:hypothetical protein